MKTTNNQSTNNQTVTTLPELNQMLTFVTSNLNKQPTTTTINVNNLLTNKFANSNMDNTSILNQFNEKEDRTQEPITSIDDINSIINYHLSHNKFRNAMLFICGINMGIRVSDLQKLRFSNLIDATTGEFRDYFYLTEQKTSKQNRVYVNQAVREIVTIYLNYKNQMNEPKDINDYLFTNEYSHNKQDNTYEVLTYTDTNNITHKQFIMQPLHYSSISDVIKNTCKTLKITGKHNTHCLRKTFAWNVIEYYRQHTNEDCNGRALMFLQNRFKHSSTLITEHYTGLTNAEDYKVCMSLNIGLQAIIDWKTNNL